MVCVGNFFIVQPLDTRFFKVSTKSAASSSLKFLFFYGSSIMMPSPFLFLSSKLIHSTGPCHTVNLRNFTLLFLVSSIIITGLVIVLGFNEMVNLDKFGINSESMLGWMKSWIRSR